MNTAVRGPRGAKGEREYWDVCKSRYVRHIEVEDAGGRRFRELVRNSIPIDGQLAALSLSASGDHPAALPLLDVSGSGCDEQPASLDDVHDLIGCASGQHIAVLEDAGEDAQSGERYGASRRVSLVQDLCL